jgi:tetratricopeptide (TPR) repeat protein
MIKNFLFLSFLFLVSTFFFNPKAFCQQSPLLEEGIEQYKQENYEEAVEVLTRARVGDPNSSTTAFFLGLAYKQTMDYEKALVNLRDAVTLTPRIKEALIELVDVAMQLGNVEEAKKWISVAEEEDIFPAKTAFLKGLILTEEGKNQEAAESFAKAKSIDPTISQAADIQIALSYLRQQELKKAKESFQTAITLDPQSDLAGFARQYLASVEERLALQRPFRFTLSVFGQYDDNMVLKPDDQAFAAGITNESSNVLNSSFRATYAPTLSGPWLFNGQYAVSSSLHDKNVHTHDSLSNSISLTPGYNFGRFALNLSASYNHAMVRSPDYEKYSGTLRVGPLMRIALKNNQLLEIFSGYTDTEYFKPALAPDEDRDAKGSSAYLSWIWLVKADAFLNLRYQYSVQDTVGQNWDNKSNVYSVNVAAPMSDRVKLQISGQITDQDFENIHSFFNIKREDTIYAFSAGLSIEVYKDITLVPQYTKMRASSNVEIYDYERSMYSLGIEYRF